MSRFAWKPGPTYRFRKITFYAMNGSICIADDKEGLSERERFLTLTRKDFLRRVEAFNGEARALGRLAAENPHIRGFAQERNEKLTLVENMLKCVADAKAQGDPNDPEVQAWFAKHNNPRRSRVGGGAGVSFRSPALQPLPLGRDTGKYCSPDLVLPDSAPVVKPQLILP